MLEQAIKHKIEHGLSCTINNSEPLSGGCIASTYKIECSNKQLYVLKTKAFVDNMFIKEANGLQELAKAGQIRTPGVILAEANFLLLEYIPNGQRPFTFFEDFGRSFARLHTYTNKHFGYSEDNYIGASPQKNIVSANESTNWCDFFFSKRILFQFKLAEKNGYVDKHLQSLFIKLEAVFPKILNGSGTVPSLLHGDLWNGNFLCDINGKACLIDPAVYYGCREADIAMTKLFGGFPDEFYSAYNEEWPLEPEWEFRQNIYKLYHILNHLNLFGKGYYHETLQLMNFYL